MSLFSQTKIKLELKQKFNYCGGAKPSQEIMDSYKDPKPYANKKLIIVSSKGKIDSVTTTAEGFFEKTLKNGDYKIYEPWNYFKGTPNGEPMANFDIECLKKIWRKPCITITVKFKSVKSSIKIDEAYCNYQMPCIKNPQYPE